jgi:N-acetylglucosaminyldiphosphoundecaprenol N-acetyl-beta-D-mannosaminyltransferase
MPIVWLAKLLGIPIAERVAGSSLFETLRNGLLNTDEAPIRVYFFGGPDGVAQQACERINLTETGKQRQPMQCTGYASPGFCSIEDMSTAPILEHINNSGADFVVVSLGARKGQAWIEHNRHKLTAPVISHLGAVVNMVAGTVLRAPIWMQRTGLEWIWRIKEEPALWRRYRDDGLALTRLMLSRVLPSLLYSQFILRQASKSETASLSIAMQGNVMKLVLQGSWTANTLDPLRRAFRSGIEDGYHIELNLAAVTFADSAFWGQLLLLYGYQGQIGRTLHITAASNTVRKLSYFSCVEFLLFKGK